MKGYDNRTAIFLAAVCSQTYAHFNDPNGSFVIPAGFELVGEFRASSLVGRPEKFGFVLQSDTHGLLAFRGTSSTSDWASDAMASQTRYKWVKNAGMAHRGFSNIYHSARTGVMALLEEISPNKTLYVTGHSLGGALATLCAIDVAANTRFRFPVTYTFGSPRVGDPAFAKAYDQKVGRSFRVHNRFDVVTHLPPVTYQLPKRGRTFYYDHVQHSKQLSFHNGSVPGNHVIGSYYAELAGADPLFAERLSAMNPGLCPDWRQYAYGMSTF
ncbi:lipase family protein [Cohnella boryungensis]|uniref:Mbeg1-like protein n=1 Tax=Cohnella boryungensis TaxID=768479 RepID=A0ABV8SBY6_9BACL